MCPTTALSPMPRPSTLADFAFTFPPESQWVRSARDAVRTALRSVAPAESELIDVAVLLTSELVTNAVVASHASLTRAAITVHGEWTAAGTVRVLVHDQAPGLPFLPGTLPGPEAERGRGLLLVTLHATDWGICHHIPGPGKLVWFALALKP